MARMVTALDRTRRKRWRCFLTPLVGGGKPVSVLELDRGLARVLGDARSSGCDDRGAIYGYLRGQRTATASTAWNIGEALRACGVAWCNGPVALYGAGHFGAWVETLRALALSADGARLALELYMWTPWVAQPPWDPSAAWTHMLPAIMYEQQVADARRRVECLISDGPITNGSAAAILPEKRVTAVNKAFKNRVVKVSAAVPKYLRIAERCLTQALPNGDADLLHVDSLGALFPWAGTIDMEFGRAQRNQISDLLDVIRLREHAGESETNASTATAESTLHLDLSEATSETGIEEVSF